KLDRRVEQGRSIAAAIAVLSLAFGLADGVKFAHAAKPEPAQTKLGPAFDPGRAIKPLDLILRIQRSLTAIGLYEGRADGRMNPDTEVAIRKYQGMIGMPATGQPSEALAERLDTGDKVNELLGKLEKAREENIRAARSALLANPATRDLIADEIAERYDPTRDIAPCLNQPTAQCLLAEAVESSKGVADKEMRDWSLGEILVVQARAGFARGARDTVRRIRDPRLIMLALRDIAEAQAQGGFAADAIAAAETIPDPLKRAEALAAIADIHIRLGRTEEARAAALRLAAVTQTLEDPLHRVTFLSREAVTLARAGDTAAADRILAEAETLARAQPASTTGVALRHVASALAELRRTNESLRLLKDIPEKSDHVPVLITAVTQEALAGNIATAHALASTLSETHHRVGLLGPVAAAQRRAGNRRAAEATLADAFAATDRITYPFAKAYALSRIALALAEIADEEKDAAARMAAFAGAAALAEQIGDDSLRAQTLWTIAAAVDRGGNADQARAIEARAERATREIKSRLDQTWMLGEIALTRARRGETEAARAIFRRGLEIAGSIENAWGRARAFARLTAVLMQIEP
ncbi:MAG: peptidoglycan-binding domain-containing protein, partial [Pseudomonadota bacterium]